MSIFPTEQRIWWNEPVEKSEVLWVSIAFLWAMIMFFMMPYWHFAGEQNLSNEAYKTTPDAFEQKTDAFVAKYTVREDAVSGYPIVAPPAGSDIYMYGKKWEWWPMLELQEGRSYRLHLSSLDYMHGWSLLPENINLQVIPNYEMVLTITPTSSGEFSVVCNEFCGIGHHAMVGKIFVK